MRNLLLFQFFLTSISKHFIFSGCFEDFLFFFSSLVFTSLVMMCLVVDIFGLSCLEFVQHFEFYISCQMGKVFSHNFFYSFSPAFFLLSSQDSVTSVRDLCYIPQFSEDLFFSPVYFLTIILIV